ncbi:hypothetical protein JOE23_002667 [Amphibacillus cookii]|nr:hypothetical protein [Amphibacillus cookii]
MKVLLMIWPVKIRNNKEAAMHDSSAWLFFKIIFFTDEPKYLKWFNSFVTQLSQRLLQVSYLY